MEPFDSARAKLDRAHEHLTALHNEVGAFLDSRPYGISSKTEMHEGTEVFRVKLPDDETLRFLRFSILAGDYVTTLRSSLDHLAWGLSLLTTTIKNPTKTPFDKTEFPIFLEARPTSVRKKIPDVPAPAQDEIERLQPYHCGNPVDTAFHPLAVIYTLTNIDKHRHIPIVRYAFKLDGTVPPHSQIKIRLIQALDDDEHIQSRPDGIAVASHSEATLKIDAVFHVLFEKIDAAQNLNAEQLAALRGLPIDQLGTLYEFVRDEVFPRLSGFFHQGAQPAHGRPRWKFWW
jgi:hypothetical protein